MLEQTAEVVKAAADGIWVKAVEPAGCGTCGGQGCSSRRIAELFQRTPRHFLVDCDLSLSPGDRVVVGIVRGSVLRSAWRAYGLPLALMLAGALLAQAVWPGDGPALAGMLRRGRLAGRTRRADGTSGGAQTRKRYPVSHEERMIMMRKALAATALVFALSVPAAAKEVVDVADLVETHGPAVVNISTTKLVKRGAENFPFPIPQEEDMQEFFRRFFPGGPGAAGGSGAFATIMASLRRRIFTLPDDTRVLPGHGPETTIGAERPCLDEWERRGW